MHTHFLNQLGQNYLDFEVTKILFIEELRCTLRELTHRPSGAQVMHIENDDPENLFCLSFKTLPSSSDGAAHILEHTVLCGSKKFPVKDPFFSMTRRSLNTFMNAMTGADFTCYPASSQVEKDFYNLLEVYLDAVFHPDLKELSFLQEGCRLEFTKPNDPTTPLVFKGIVFNEMKGSLSSADSRLWHTLIEQLTPDLPYAHNSGGDPKHIPNLTYSSLISFYETFYHPSRCLFYFYGNLPLKQHLDFIYENTLKHILPQDPISPIPLQRRFTEPVKKTYSYPVTEDESSKDRTMVSFGWLTCPIIQQEDVLALTILDALLMDTDASPLKKILLESGLCMQADAFMDNEMSEMPYVITFKGCEEKNIDELEQLLLTSLQKIADTPIEEHLIDAVIHQIEFSRLEITGDHSPFGLTLFLRSALAKQHGCEPENALVVYSLFERLSQKAKDPNFLKEILEKYIINNPHFVRITFLPDAELAQKESEAETELLSQIKKNLSQLQIDKIVKQTAELKKYQKTVENQSLDCLPKVTLEDVPISIRDYPLKRKKHGNFETFHHDCFTNHIIHADLCFDLPQIKEEDLPYLQLLLTLLPQLGAGNRDYIKNLEYIQAHTGGISASSSLHVQATDANKLNPSLTIRGKALQKKSDKLFGLYRDMITRPHLNDPKRVSELIKQIHSSLISKLPRHALRYAIQEALSGFHLSTHINNLSFGLNYLHTIETIYQDLDKNYDQLIEKLTRLNQEIFTYQNPHLILSCDAQSFKELEKNNFYDLFTELASRPSTPWTSEYTLPVVPSQARSIAAPVAYNVKAFPSISFIHPHTPALTVATQLFDNKVLLSKIREQGGAYGAGANFSSMTGCFYFHSYRDPHIIHTLEAFDLAIDTIASGEFSDADLEEAKLGIIQQLDTPISPGNKAITGYNWWRDNKSVPMREEFRRKILELSKAELQHAVTAHLSGQKESGIVVCFGNKDLIEKENRKLKKTKEPLKILRI